MKNPFEKLVPRFSAPNQPVSEDITISQKHSVASLEKKVPSSVRLFDVQNKAGKFTDLPFIKENLKNETDRKIEKEKQALLQIFESGNIETIIDFLQEDAALNFIFNKEIEQTKEQYREQLSSATFLNNKDWKILTGLKIFDIATLEHSIGTYLVIKEKIEERLKELGQEIIREGVPLEQLYRACLLHDIGKMAIPEFILNSQATDEDWTRCFMMLDSDEQDEILVKNEIIVPDAVRDDIDEMINFFAKKRIRAVKFVPIKAILTQEQQDSLLSLGINPDNPLRTIMQIHEEKSEEILNSLDYVIESMLAGNHHNYKHVSKKLGEKPSSLSALHISTEIASNILHLGDVQQALNGDRAYHHKQPMLRIMAFLIDDAAKGTVDPTITASWINDELKKMSPAYLAEVKNKKALHQDAKYVQERYDELVDIENFISTILPEKNSIPIAT